MTAHPTDRTASPFEASRAVATTVQPLREARDWSPDMDAVARRRDRDCLMRIYDHFMPRVCLYLRGLGTPDAVAEELAQDALLKLWLRAHLYDAARSSLSTWLFRIARNLYIDRVRREPGWMQAQDAVALAATEDGLAIPSSAESYVDQAQLKRRIDALSSVQARLIRMSYFEAKSHQEIAAALGMPLGTVKSHLRRAFLRLQSEIEGQP